jgi:hypothetical protein
MEGNNKINFLDITILQHLNVIEAKICRKLTTIDCIIPADSCHPREYKISGVRFLLNRIMKYPISDIYQGEGKKTILAVTRNNQFNQNSVESIQKEIDKFGSVTEPGKVQKAKTKFITFTYAGKEVTHIPKLLKKLNLGVALKTKIIFEAT